VGHGLVVVVGQIVLGDLVGGGLPHPIVGHDVVEDLGQVLHPVGPAHHVRMEGDAHEPPVLGALPVELIELGLADLGVEALGHHWSLSADRPKGARYLLAAGDWARAVYANEDAIRHYERTLGVLRECHAGDAEQRAVRERLADLRGLTGRRAEALAHYETLRQELEAVGDRGGAARVLRKIGGLHWEAGDRERAAACFAAGLELIREDGDPIERGHLFQEMGRLAFRAGDNAGAIAWAERALAEAGPEEEAAAEPERACEAAAMRTHAYNTLGVALARTGRPAEAVGQIERSIALAEARELLQAACRGYTNLGVLYSSLDPQRSIETCLRGLETAKKVGDLGCNTGPEVLRVEEKSESVTRDDRQEAQNDVGNSGQDRERVRKGRFL
jgi:tetratricopeptide (TPR) repeat protein